MTTSTKPCPEANARLLVSDLRQACAAAGVTRMVASAVAKNAADLSLCVAFASLSESDEERLEYLSLAAIHSERVHADIEALSLREVHQLDSAAAMTEWLAPAVADAMAAAATTEETKP